MTGVDVVERARRRLGRVGVFGMGVGALAGITADQERGFARTLADAGYGSFWVGEGIGGKDIFVRLGLALAETKTMMVGTGIANVWAHRPRGMHAAAATLAEAYPDRFVHGIGIGHAMQAAKVGEPYQPMRQLREYLDQLEAPIGEGYAEVPSPDTPFPRVLAAVGPKMLALAAERTDGVFPFVQPVAQTALAREILGPDKLVVQHLSVLLTDDVDAGYANVAAMFDRIRRIPAYRNSYLRFGFTEEDIAEASRRLLAAVFAVGDEDAILARVREHVDAGADHVLISPVVGTLAEATDQLTRLAPALIGGMK